MNVGDDLKKLKRSLGSIKEPYIAAILLFGSRARGEGRERSDYDFLVLHRGLEMADPVMRRRAIYKVIREAVRDTCEGLTVIDMRFEDFLSPEEVTPLLLNIYWDSVVLLDRIGELEEFLRKVRKNIVAGGLRRVRDGAHYSWVLPEPLKRVKIV